MRLFRGLLNYVAYNHTNGING